MSYSKSKLLLQPNQLQPKKPQPLLPNGPLCDHDNLCVLNTLTSGNIKTNTISANSIKLTGTNNGEQVDIAEMLARSLDKINIIDNSMMNKHMRYDVSISNLNSELRRQDQKLSSYEGRITNITRDLSEKLDVQTFSNEISSLREQLLQQLQQQVQQVQQLVVSQVSSLRQELQLLEGRQQQHHDYQQIVNSNYDQRLRNLESRR